MTWLDEEWDTAKAVLSHSESIAELGWVVLKMSVKSSEGCETWCVDWMMLAQPILMLHILRPHFSFLFILPSACLFLHLASSFQSPILHPLGPSNGQKDVPTQSHQLPTRASRDSISWGLDLSQDLGWLAWKFDSCVVHTAKWSSSKCHPDLLPLIKARSLPTSVMSSPTWYGLWGRRREE